MLTNTFYKLEMASFFWKYGIVYFILVSWKYAVLYGPSCRNAFIKLIPALNCLIAFDVISFLCNQRQTGGDEEKVKVFVLFTMNIRTRSKQK